MTMPPFLAALDRKLLRDLWEMKGQALAIAAVIGAGVTMFVMYLSNFDSLQRTVDTYYERQRLGDVFASATRVPQRVAERIAAIPGVSAVDTRVVADVTIDVPDMPEPATGRLISIPATGRPVLNDIFLRSGRWPELGRPDEVLASEAFCEKHRFSEGSRVAAIINGRRRSLTIVGVALSPEYVYSIRPGELFPDDRRFGIFWMERRALASAFDMEGGFNDVSIKLARGAAADDVIGRLDALLEPYGGLGAIPRELQMSVWTVSNEFNQLQTFGFITPLIFLSVAAFILNVALTRALALQRAQIAALKALGYSNAELAWHYIKWALAIAAAGAAMGVAAGAYLGSAMITLYNDFFRFPVLDYRLSVGVAVASIAGSLVVAALGAWTAVGRAVKVPPAEAMRPEAPARYRRSVIERLRFLIRMPPATRMVLRNMERQPVRVVLSVVGVGFAGAILLVGLSFIDVMDVLINEQFVLTMREDATVSFVEPRSSDAIYAVQRLPGVMAVEPARAVAVRLRAGHRHRTLAISGMPAGASLARAVDRDGRVVALPPDGLVLSKMLGQILHLAAGDTVRVEVLEGERPVRDVPVVALVDDSVGLQAYMDLEALHRLMREGRTVTGANLMVDPARLDDLYRHLKLMPAIAGVALRELTLENFRKTMAESMNLLIVSNVIFSAIIAFGVVYNSARVSLSERTRELASLRVLGFTRAEISMILLGELALVTVMALPIGVAIGWALGALIMTAFNNELYRLPFSVSSQSIAWTCLTVILAASVSALAVRRRLDRLDLVGVLKSRE